MLIPILWISTSLLIAGLGRNRRGGFWGMLFFSLICTPLVGGLSLLLAKGPVDSVTTTVLPGAPTLSRRRETALVATSLPGRLQRRTIWTQFLVSFVLLVLVSGGIFVWLSGARNADRVRFWFQTSLDAATFHVSPIGPASGGEDTRRGVKLLLGLERFAVLVIALWTAARLVASSRTLDRFLAQRRASGSAAQQLVELERLVAEQMAQIERLKDNIASEVTERPAASSG